MRIRQPKYVLHLPQYTKHRKGKGQFKRKKTHWADRIIAPKFVFTTGSKS